MILPWQSFRRRLAATHFVKLPQVCIFMCASASILLASLASIQWPRRIGYRRPVCASCAFNLELVYFHFVPPQEPQVQVTSLCNAMSVSLWLKDMALKCQLGPVTSGHDSCMRPGIVAAHELHTLPHRLNRLSHSHTDQP